MASNRFERQRELIDSLLKGVGNASDDFREFLRQCVDLAPLETLEGSKPEALVALARSLYDETATLDGVLVSIRPPDGDSPMAHLSTACVDRPFLVDSMSMAVRDAGASIDWLIHPVIRVERDDQGQRLRVVPRDDDGGQEESYIRLLFDPLANDQAYQQLEQRVHRVMADLQAVVEDYVPMRRRVQSIIAELKYPAPGCDEQQFAEAQAFLEWLDADHFTFLGFRQTQLIGEGEQRELQFVPDSGLGLLRDERTRDLDAPYVAPPTELQKYANSSRLVVITKSAARSHIHHPDYMDSISLKHYDERGEVVGTYRFLGLFATNVYVSPTSSIPIVRRKLDYVVAKTRLPSDSHAAKSLRDVIESLPRDELFQGGEGELYEMALAIRALRDRQQLKFLMRRDRYGRFYSCLIYMPRDRYGWQVRERMEEILQQVFDANGIERQVQFMRDGFARIHFLVRTRTGTKIEQTASQIEARLLEATRTWQDALREELTKRETPQEAARLMSRYGDAFQAGYISTVSAADAADDIAVLESLDEQTPWQPRLLLGEPARVKLYISGDPDALSEVLPTLEHFGLSVGTQRPYRLAGAVRHLWIQEFECRGVPAESDEQAARRFEAVMKAVRSGHHENDHLNSLVFSAGLDWRRIGLVRAWLRYLVQTGMPYSPSYMAEIMSTHGELIAQIVTLFEQRFDPDHSQGDQAEAQEDAIRAALDAVDSLDADRLLRACLDVVRACLRTNYYQQDDAGQPKAWITLKLDPAKIPELPKPLPQIETFVYAPDVEGVHLRGGMVARGGLRWSDRREDFRTEVLGLMKAQMVKNAVIVPVGAKGGFVVKKRVSPADRDAFQQAGIAAYKTFIRGLLDITDNRVGNDIVKPDGVVCYDPDDPYLVVAADKGTASFSDIANGISEDYGFWLGDAFASGGKAGYDHKKMGITARSAWESVKRHFREMGRDTQSEAFTVIGIGDMSGDVFGNGMLLSEQIRLVGAFNHLHIFIDPDPDPAASFAERKRLFELGRSSWSDYDEGCISEGGGIFERSAKRIDLNDAMRRVLCTDAESLRPNELIQAMLKAPVDLLWNGGIGTYVRASDEANADVGDRSNDVLRVTARDLRCKVIGEGGNLGLTQRGRIEYALQGGRINTDAIDNVGGVASSDREVNIKIPLNEAIRAGDLAEETRNGWLADATDAVARFVLRDAYEQGRVISMMQANAAVRLDEHANLMRMLERKGLLDRAIEFLPNEDELAERRNRRIGLTRPELAVLLAYSKIALFQTLLDSELPDDPGLEPLLTAYFPESLRSQRPEAFASHRLRRELIATQVTNHLVDTMGMAFPHRIAAEQGVGLPAVARAFVVATRVLQADSYYDDIQALDGSLHAKTQYQLMARVAGLIKHACTVFLLHPDRALSIEEQVSGYHQDLEAIEAGLPQLLPTDYRADWTSAAEHWQEQSVPEALALRIASTRVLGPALEISALRQSSDRPLELVARTFFHVGEAFSMLWMHRAINSLEVSGRWPALARATLRDDAHRLHGLITEQVLRESGDSPEALFDAWAQRYQEPVQFARRRIGEIRDSSDAADFLGLSVAVRELRKLRLMEASAG